MKFNWVTMVRDVLILWSIIHLAGRFFGPTGYLLVACSVLVYLVYLQRKNLLKKGAEMNDPTLPPTLTPYRIRYNTKNDGARDFWRIIDNTDVEHAADRIESTARMETEILVVDGVLKGNVVIWASSFCLADGVAYFR